jgi:hypothetical protein
MSSLYVVSVSRSQNSVACPNGGTELLSHHLFFRREFLFATIDMTVRKQKSNCQYQLESFRFTNPAWYSRIYSYEQCFTLAR